MEPVHARARVDPYLACACVVVALGTAARLYGVSSMSLWVDEAIIANAVSAGQLPGYLRYPASNRPFGYLVASGWIAAVHNSELTLRLLSVVPSIGTLVLLAWISRRLFRSHALALTALAAMAANAWSVTFVKDFKPYALEQFLVVWLLFLYMMWIRRGHSVWLVALATTAAASPLFSHTAVFALPWYGVLVWLELRERGAARRAVWFELAIATALVVAIVFNDDEAATTRDMLSRSGATVTWDEDLAGAKLILAQRAPSGAAE